jgi:hypothetical protein
MDQRVTRYHRPWYNLCQPADCFFQFFVKNLEVDVHGQMLKPTVMQDWLIFRNNKGMA